MLPTFFGSQQPWRYINDSITLHSPALLCTPIHQTWFELVLSILSLCFVNLFKILLPVFVTLLLPVLTCIFFLMVGITFLFDYALNSSFDLFLVFLVKLPAFASISGIFHDKYSNIVQSLYNIPDIVSSNLFNQEEQVCEIRFWNMYTSCYFRWNKHDVKIHIIVAECTAKDK